MNGLVLCSFLIFQFRVHNTLRRLILTKDGEHILISRFRLMGFSEEVTKAPNDILTGIHRSLLKTNSIYGGGFNNY